MNTPKRHCTKCDTDYPETEEYFFPSDLREGRNACKTCRNQARRQLEKVGVKTKLKQVAQHIYKDEVPNKSLHDIAKTIGCSVTTVENNVYKNRDKLQIFQYSYNNSGFSLALRLEDAEAYISANRSAEPDSIAPPIETESPVLGIPLRQCGSCGIETGNILGDPHNTADKQLGFLCSKCLKLIRDSYEDIDRMRKVIHYLERTRGKRV